MVDFMYREESKEELDTLRPVTLRAYFNTWAQWQEGYATGDLAAFEEDLEPFSSDARALVQAITEAEEEDYTFYREEQAKLLHFNIVMHTCIPIYFDRHPRAQFQNYC